LPVNCNTPADNPKQNEHNDKNWLCIQPFIQVIAYSKTKKDRPRHGQSDLHDQCRAVDPLYVIFKIKYFEPQNTFKAGAPPRIFSWRFLYQKSVCVKNKVLISGDKQEGEEGFNDWIFHNYSGYQGHG
jgi:hypothetical protein